MPDSKLAKDNQYYLLYELAGKSAVEAVVLLLVHGHAAGRAGHVFQSVLHDVIGHIDVEQLTFEGAHLEFGPKGTNTQTRKKEKL